MLGSRVGGTGVGNYDSADNGSDTLDRTLDPILFILNDHAERNTHTAPG